MRSKPHYLSLDGLRGIAALIVVSYHVFEAFATSHADQIVNHGYLAVDFFFILSGFVMGYAYDERWAQGMTAKAFFKRRLIRLHPMVIAGAVIGVAGYVMTGCKMWDGTTQTILPVLLSFMLTILMIPSPSGVDLRGYRESFPLNGPQWSLFFEYIGNILYALVLRRLSTKALGVVSAIGAIALAGFAFFGENGDVNAGFSVYGLEFPGGLSRLIYAYPMGLLMARLFRERTVKSSSGAFWISAIVLLILLPMPRIPGCLNAVYEMLILLLVFPLIVWKNAGSLVEGAREKRIMKTLGDMSYPLYMVHYPLIYIYYGWVQRNGLTFGETLPQVAMVVGGSLLLAWVCMKFYDKPIRVRLNNKI